MPGEAISTDANAAPSTARWQLWQRSFPHHETSVADARRFAAEAVTAWGITDRLDDVRLCVSEVATNALVHVAHPGAAVAAFEVRLTLDRATILLEVHDSGPGHPTRRAPTADAGHGRGLLLVDALADAWGVRAEPAGKTVWLLFRGRLCDGP